MKKLMGKKNLGTLDNFLDDVPDNYNNKKVKVIKKVVSKKVVTCNDDDLKEIEEQIMRAIKLGFKDKGIAGTFKMGIKALKKASDKDYLKYYSET